MSAAAALATPEEPLQDKPDTIATAGGSGDTSGAPSPLQPLRRSDSEGCSGASGSDTEASSLDGSAAVKQRGKGNSGGGGMPPAHRPASAAGAARPPLLPPRPESAGAASLSDEEGAAGEVALTEERFSRSAFIDLQHPVTLYEGVKLVLMAPVVLLKLLLLAVAVPYAWAVLWLLLLGHKPQTPMRPFRAFLVRQWIQQWGRFLLLVVGFYYIPTRGWQHLKEAEECRAILVFNHPSYVDAAAMGTFFTPSGISKAGVAEIPFIGRFALALQLFFVERRGSSDRSNKHVLRGDAVGAISERSADRRFPLVAIAPEATTKAQPCVLKFRRGAFVAGQPVCPVLLRYRFRHFNPGWGVCNTPFHVYRLIAQFVNHLEIEVLPSYHPSDEEQRDWRLFAENVRRLMGTALGVPLVEEGLAEERQLVRQGVRVNLLGTRVLLPRQTGGGGAKED